MPIYEYRCEACLHQLDVLQKVSDPLLTDCPECGEPSLRKLISAPSFRLKGSGWYETDFKTGNKKNLAGEKEPKTAAKDGDGKADAKPDKKAGAGADAKPAATPKQDPKTRSGAGKGPAAKGD